MCIHTYIYIYSERASSERIRKQRASQPNLLMSHVSYMNESCHAYKWVIHAYPIETANKTFESHRNNSQEWVMSHIWMWVMSHIWISLVTWKLLWVYRVTQMNESWMSHVKYMNVSHVPQINELYHIYECESCHIWMSHVTHMNVSHVTHLGESRHIKSVSSTSRHTHEWVMSNIIWVMSHKWMSHVM